jgi:hypothetical protein
MEHRGLAAFCLLTFIAFCISCASAQGWDTSGSDYKWSFALTYSKEELAKSGLTITDDDIAYGERMVAKGESDCERMEAMCKYAQDDRAALENMRWVQARQRNNPSPEQVDTSPIPDLTNLIDSAFKQLLGIVKGLFGWD